jgi:hypothetical protein
MSSKQVAFGRQARSVHIVSTLPIHLQREIAAFWVKNTPKVIHLETATIRILESVSGDLIIEIEPP